MPAEPIFLSWRFTPDIIPSGVALIPLMAASMIPLAWDEIKQHNKKDDCWVVVDGVVYDMTDFLDDHPGGKRLPVKHSGKDVTEIWNSFHGETAW